MSLASCNALYIYMPLDQFAAYFFKLKQHILPFSVGNVEELRTTKIHFWHVLESIFSGPFLTIKLGKF